MPPRSNQSIPLTLWEQHRQRWECCTACDLCYTRKKVCLARGDVPCDILFAGEAPGFSEDALGSPFIGPAGHLLDSIVERSVPPWVKRCFTNLIACIPLDPESRSKIESPPKHAVEACSPRLIEFVAICNPKLIITVGNDPRDWLDPSGYRDTIDIPKSIPRVTIQHPASILRVPVARKGLDIQRCIVTISHAVEDYVLKGKDGEQE